ncbi:MAG TPA: ABC transporter permease [Bryobacteraceae bacterium]|nr:ABC transporter permease [Bryobacteraceae bacterium]
MPSPLISAVRSLRRRPGYALAAVSILSFGIAANTAVFSIVDATILKPLPYPGPERLTTVMEGNPKTGREGLIAPGRLEDWNRMNRTFEAISGLYAENVTDTSRTEPERLTARRVVPRYFQVFQTPPALGRYFTAAEERENGPAAAVISYSFWKRRFHNAPTALNQRLVLAGKGYSIVGIAPDTFASPSIDIWLPAQINSFLMGIRQARFITGVGRMKPGVTIEQAREDLSRVQNQLGAQFPATDKGWSANVTSLKEFRVGSYRRAMVLIFAAVAILFLISTANTAALALTQSVRRSAEFAIRRALGAGSSRIGSLALSESAVLGGLAALVGSGLAAILVNAFRQELAALPRPAEIALDWRALAVAIAAGCAAAVLCGLVPFLISARRDTSPLLALTGRSSPGERHRWQTVLAGAQIALTVVLLAGAGLMLRSYRNLTMFDAGFDSSRAATFHVGAAWDEDRNRIGRVQQDLLDALAVTPGVEAAGFANFLPASGATLRYQYRFGNGEPITAGERSVTRDYFRAIGVPILAGDSCPPFRAVASRQPAALLNQAFVKQYLNDASPVGRTFSMQDTSRPFEVVGVVGNVREDALNSAPVPYVYICLGPGNWPDPEYVVRSTGAPGGVFAGIRSAVHRVDSSRALFGLDTLSNVVNSTLDQPKLDAEALGFFSFAALLLAGVGIYSLVTLLAISKTREIGVRMALGAQPQQVTALLFRIALQFVVGGMAVGLAGAFFLGRAMRSLLFGIPPADPVSLALALAIMGLAAGLAALFPALRAARVDPMSAIRAE